MKRIREKENRNNVSLLTIIEKFCTKCFVTHTAHHKTIQIKPKSVGISLGTWKCAEIYTKNLYMCCSKCTLRFVVWHKGFCSSHLNSVIFVCCVHSSSIWLVCFSVRDTFQHTLYVSAGRFIFHDDLVLFYSAKFDI